ASLVEITGLLFNETFMFDVNDRTSQGFSIQEQKFCSDIKRYFSNGPLSRAFDECYVLKMSLSPERKITFHLIFGDVLTASLKDSVINQLETNAPSYTIDNRMLLEIGDLFLISGNYNVTLHPVNISGTNTFFPTIAPTPSSEVIKTTLEIRHCLRQPCLNGGTCREQFDSFTCTCITGWTGFDCSQ
ncbi:hypothetical protein ACJMK2_019210, partial [Sinanodonta woodiana]